MMDAANRVVRAKRRLEDGCWTTEFGVCRAPSVLTLGRPAGHRRFAGTIHDQVRMQTPPKISFFATLVVYIFC